MKSSIYATVTNMLLFDFLQKEEKWLTVSFGIRLTVHIISNSIDKTSLVLSMSFADHIRNFTKEAYFFTLRKLFGFAINPGLHKTRNSKSFLIYCFLLIFYPIFLSHIPEWHRIYTVLFHHRIDLSCF